MNKTKGQAEERRNYYSWVYLGCFSLKEQFIVTCHPPNSKSCAREVSAVTLPSQVKKLRHTTESGLGKGITSAHVIKAKEKEIQYVTVQGYTWLPVEYRSRAGRWHEPILTKGQIRAQSGFTLQAKPSQAEV